MTLKQIAKLLKDWYWKEGKQRLVVDTFEDRTYDPMRNTGFDVHLKNGNNGTFLFSMSNYDAFFDVERTNGQSVYFFYDTTTVASLPYYQNQHFFVRKWTPLTDEDIYKCTKYFVDKVLGLRYDIWNVSVEVQKQIPEDKQLELPLEYK